MRGKILIADDEMDIISFIQNYFESEGYEVLTAMNGLEAVEKAVYQPDLILLDIMMPSIDGLEVCRSIRQRIECPILFLTARIEDRDKLLAFGAGGDDYIIKPFSIEELGARVEAHLRRERRIRNPSNHKSFGRLYLNFGQRIVCYDRNEIDFTRKEYDIVELLSLYEGQVFSKSRIYERVWGMEAGGDDNVVTEHIKRIRAKIAIHTSQTYIETVWGVGYKWLPH
jgi:DNA-binding response OmpR family regulator